LEICEFGVWSLKFGAWSLEKRNSKLTTISGNQFLILVVLFSSADAYARHCRSREAAIFPNFSPRRFFAKNLFVRANRALAEPCAEPLEKTENRPFKHNISTQ
jgi:hypothetical protein